MKNSALKAMLLPRKGYIVTPIIIGICVILFIIITVSGADIIDSNIEILIDFGANYKPYTLNNEYWRLITACFLHIGILHLFFNMYALVYIGNILEPLIGSKKFLLAFLVTGIAGSATSLWWNDLVVSAGASGAIFGLFGIYIALISTNLANKAMQKKILTNMAFFVGVNLLIGSQAGFDNAGHVGGLLAGLIFGYALYPFLAFPYHKLKNVYILSTGNFIILLFSVILVFNSDTDIIYYERILENYSEFEETALTAYQVPENTSDQIILEKINETGLPHWKKAIQTLSYTDTLDVPEELTKRIALLKEYTLHRIKVMELVKKSIEVQSENNLDQIEFHNQQINLIMKKLQGKNVPDSLLKPIDY